MSLTLRTALQMGRTWINRLNHAPVGFSFIDCFARRETDQRPSRLLFSSEGHLLKKMSQPMYKPNSSQPSFGGYSFSGDTLSRSADRAAGETRFSSGDGSFPKRQENLARLDRTSFCRRSSGRPLKAARLLPFPFSVVSDAQTCPFSFVTAPTPSDASDMFDFP